MKYLIEYRDPVLVEDFLNEIYKKNYSTLDFIVNLLWPNQQFGKKYCPLNIAK